jgi:uncharacterized protein (DUF302 family)
MNDPALLQEIEYDARQILQQNSALDINKVIIILFCIS